MPSLTHCASKPTFFSKVLGLLSQCRRWGRPGDRSPGIHHQRQSDGTILTTIVHDGVLTLVPPGIELGVAEMFDLDGIPDGVRP